MIGEPPTLRALERERCPEFAGIHPLVIQRYLEIRHLKTLTEHRNNFFTVIFPADDRINLFKALSERSMDGRNLTWWAYKRGIDFNRIRGIHWEDGHVVMDIMLSENADESQSRHDAFVLYGSAPAVPDVIRFSEYQDPTSFGGVQDVNVITPSAGEE